MLTARMIIGIVAILHARPRPVGGTPVTIDTEYGAVEGRTTADGGVEIFHGVPFAAPPLGDLRWTAPQPPTPWNNVVNATVSGPSCPQFDIVRFVHEGSEDCLYLSVYKPARCTPESPCPVMQWIYGGAWIIGSNENDGEYDGAKIAEKHGVVVIAANYRLDVLGWLALAELEQESPTGSFGNYGLMDQGFALQWTRKNAAVFGGDSNRVTIFGESAGGFSVCQHLTRPASNGLFSHAIMESGGCDGPWATFDGANSKRWGDYYTQKVGCPSEMDKTARLRCLRAKSLDEVLEPYLQWLCPISRPDDPWCNRSNSFQEGQTSATIPPGSFPGAWPNPRPPLAPIIGWAATVDGSADGLPETPYRAMLGGRINKSPTGEAITVIFGTNADEMALFIAAAGVTFPGATLPLTTDDLSIAAKHLVSYHRPSWNDSMINTILEAYTGSAWKNAFPAWKLTGMGTDFVFLCPMRLAATALSNHGINVYVYLYDFKDTKYQRPGSLLCQLESEVGCGVQHSDELKYVFGRGLRNGTETTVSDNIQTWWTNLAIHGTPTTAGAAVVWPTYTSANPNVMVISENPTVVRGDPPNSRCSVWDALPLV